MSKVNSKSWWDSIVPRWKKNNDKRDRPIEFSRMASEIESGPILEVGFGLGSFCKYIKDEVHYFGVDISSAMVEEARKLFPKRIFLEINVLNLNVAKWENAFEYACAFQTLEHFSEANFKTIMKNLKAVSRVGLLVSVPRGKPTPADLKADGHMIGWEDGEAFAEAVSEFGEFIEIHTARNHIAGVVKWQN